MGLSIEWGDATALPSEHRLFESIGSWKHGGIAIADNSGFLPEFTDDGIIWLDRDWPLMVGGDHLCAIPVKRERDGERFSIKTHAATILWLSREYRWTIEDHDLGRYYNVR